LPLEIVAHFQSPYFSVVEEPFCVFLMKSPFRSTADEDFSRKAQLCRSHLDSARKSRNGANATDAR